MRVSVWMVVFTCVSPTKDWQPVQGVSFCSLYDSWGGLIIKNILQGLILCRDCTSFNEIQCCLKLFLRVHLYVLWISSHNIKTTVIIHAFGCQAHGIRTLRHKDILNIGKQSKRRKPLILFCISWPSFKHCQPKSGTRQQANTDRCFPLKSF